MLCLGRFVSLSALVIVASCMPYESDERIKNGEVVDDGDFSFTARIERKDTHVCTGVLVDSKWVATLSKCTEKGSRSEYKILFKVSDAANGKKYISRSIKSKKAVGDDIILLKLNKKVLRKADGVRSFNRFSSEKKDGKMADCKAIGFSSNGEPNEVGVNIMSTKNCRQQNRDKYLCLDTMQGKLCQNDNGAPVMCKLKKEWYLIGLLFSEKGCGKKNIKGLRVSHISRSIQKIISSKGSSTDNVCHTPGCVKAAARMIEAMDSDVNPCDDFYQFACGGWMKQNGLPEDMMFYSIIVKMSVEMFETLKTIMDAGNKPSAPEAIMKTRNFYKACMNTEKIEEDGLLPVHQYLEDFGGLPVLGQRPGGFWDPKKYDIEDLLSRTTLKPLAKLNVYTDPRDSTRNIVLISGPAFGMPTRDYFLKGRRDKTLMAYQTKLQDMYVFLGANESAANEYAELEVDLEVDLANVSGSTSLYRAMAGSFKGKFEPDVMKITQMSMQRAGITLDDSEEVYVRDLTYFSSLGNILSKYPDRVVVNYAVSKLLQDMTLYLPQEFRNIEVTFQKVLYGYSGESPRQTTCTNEVFVYMPAPSGRLYVEEVFTKQAKSEVQDMVGQIKKSFKGIINRSSWLSEPTKQYAKEKVNAINDVVGYEKMIFDDVWLNSVYANVTVYIDNPFLTAVNIQTNSMRRKLQSLRQGKLGFGSASTVNAFYMFGYNEIVLFSGILQLPFYAEDRPAYMNYGGIGMFIGHEITHGFDSTGRYYNKNGKLENWWTSEDSVTFNQKAKCLVDQYSSYIVPGTDGLTINGGLTLGENIADSGGLKQSFEGYQEWVASSRKGRKEDKLPGLKYSPAQLFFLSFAQSWCANGNKEFKTKQILTGPHSFNQFRVIGALQNYEEFSNAWKCPTGSFMNPAEKCSVW